MSSTSDRASALSLLPYLREEILAKERPFVSWAEVEAVSHGLPADRDYWRLQLAHAFAIWPRVKQTEQGLEFEYWAAAPYPPIAGPLPSWSSVKI
jgi:hypothetical protein